MSSKTYGLPGERYNNLVVVGEAERRRGKRYVECVCDCGNYTVVRLSHLRNGTTQGCGCGVGSPTHRMSDLPEYKSWQHIKYRCLNKNCDAYPNYGGRGITICNEWVTDFAAFYDHIGPKPGPSYSVDRIDNDRGYEPGNVRWADHITQVRNTRQNRVLNFDGRSMSLGAWAEELDISAKTIQTRLSRGWSVERALDTPTLPRETKRGGLYALGVLRSLPEWERITGIPFKIILARLGYGWDPDRAVTEGSNIMKCSDIIIGVDEVGNGPIAGPLYVAAVVLPKNKVIEGVKDSKKISPKKRIKLVNIIDKECLFWIMAVSYSDTIDQFGIRNCNKACAAYCAHAARQRFPDALTVIDGQDLVEGVPSNEQRAIVGADDKYQAVSAASIIAKVHRDKYMVEISSEYPDYLFEKHKGYPTKIHKDALVAHGICPEHRKSYGPVKQVLQSMS